MAKKTKKQKDKRKVFGGLLITLAVVACFVSLCWFLGTETLLGVAFAVCGAVLLCLGVLLKQKCKSAKKTDNNKNGEKL